MCLKRNGSSPVIEDRGSGRRKSRLTSSSSARVDVLEVLRDGCERPSPEHPPDHRGVLEHELRGPRERIDARSDQRLDGVRDRHLAVSALCEQAHHLLEEKWIPFRLVEHLGALFG
jgi:hypothetical protein